MSSKLPAMESQHKEATENIDQPPLASVNEEISSDVNHSTSVGTTENQEFSDAISSGSSFEILSMKEGAGKAQESQSDSILSSLENCGIAFDTKRSSISSDESYRAERTKKYVMESEFDFVEDEGSSDSDHFVKVSRVNMMYNPGGEDSDRPSSVAPEFAEQPIPAVILESDRQNYMAEHLLIEPEIETSDDGIQQNDSDVIPAAQIALSEQIRVTADKSPEGCVEDSVQNKNRKSFHDRDRIVAVQEMKSDGNEEPEENRVDVIVKDDSLMSATACQTILFAHWLKNHLLQNQRMRTLYQRLSGVSYFNVLEIFIGLVLSAIVTGCVLALTLGLGEHNGCTYKDIDENFHIARRNESSFPRCVEHSMAAKELYHLAATVHVDQMTYLNVSNVSLSHEVSKLSKANQELEDSLTDMKTRFSEQLVKNKELEDHIAELMASVESRSSTRLKELIKHKPAKDLGMHNDEWDPSKTPSSQNENESSDVSNAFICLMKMIRDFQNTAGKREQGNRDHKKRDVQKQTPVFQTFLHLFVKTSANVSGRNFADQLTVLENLFSVMGQCVNRLQILMPSKTVHNIFNLNWHEIQKIVSLETSGKEKVTSKRESKLKLEPCRMFMSKPSKNSSAGLYAYGKKELQKYINKTLDAVDKIDQMVKSTLEAIKTLPDKFLNDGGLFNSFGHRFNTTIDNMSKRFNKGYGKLKEKVNKKFKKSLSDLGKSARAGWDKISKRSNSIGALLREAKNKFWKKSAKWTEKSNQPIANVAVDGPKKVHCNTKMGMKHFEEVKAFEEVDVKPNVWTFHIQSEDVEASTKVDETVNDMDSLLHNRTSDWLDESRLMKEVSEMRAERTFQLEKVSFDILKLTVSDFNSLDPWERKEFLRRLSEISLAGSDISNWVKNWLNCQQNWWHEVSFGDSARLKEVIASCSSWLLKWQFEVQDVFVEKKLIDNSWDKGPLSFSLSDKMNLNRLCKGDDCFDQKQNEKGNDKQTAAYVSPEMVNKKRKHKNSKTKYGDRDYFGADDDRDAKWYFRHSEFGDSSGDRDAKWYFRHSGNHEFSDPYWYFKMMEDRENGRHNSKWYFKNRRIAAKQYHKYLRRGYRGR